jgi:DNA repair protein RAD5
MSFADSDGPPPKKRRFFTEKSDILDSVLAPEQSLPTEVDAFSSVAANTAPDEGYHDLDDSSTAVAQNGHPATEFRDHMPLGFDQEMFESVIGDKVPPDVMKRLREASGDNMERAVNMFFDGSWKTAVPKSFSARGSNSRTMTINAFGRPEATGQHKTPPKSDNPAPNISPRNSMPEFRYAGAFGVAAWATRSGNTLLKHGEPVRIERQKIQPPKAPVGKGKGRPVTQPSPKPNTAAAKRVDVIVRFTNSRGEEVGRLPRECANWVSTLIDQKVCKFDGTCVYAPERIRTNDTIFLQLRCSLLRTAFDNAGFKLPDNRTTGLFEEKETSEEKELRLRQVALVKLFEEVSLLPSRTSDTTEKHKREGLLQAAEIAEQYENQKPKNGDAPDTGSSSTPSEEVEDGKELEQDQLDALYKKAQSFDFNAPAAEPAETFAMSLRHYQKQALHWMMSKEKDEKDGHREVSMHPLWEEYAWPIKDMDDKDLPQVVGQDKFYVNPYSGELSLNFPIQEQNCLGGILADEMGLGKTIEMMSLVHSHKSEVAMRLEKSNSAPTSVNSLPRLPVNSSAVEWAPCTTLVIAPMSLLAQWQSEAENASKEGTMKSMVYYGSEKTANLQALCCEANAASAPNVIITSYGVVLSEFNQVAAKNGDRGSHGGLFSLK